MRTALPAAAAFAALIVTTMLPSSAAQASPGVPVAAPTREVVAGEYIVTTRRGKARDVSAKAGGSLIHVYEHAMHGFAAQLTDAQLGALRRDRDVLAIAPNQVARPDSLQTPTPNWVSTVLTGAPCR